MNDERESEEVQLPPSPMRTVLKWLGIISALSALVGYGIWIGTIQNTIQTLKDDVDENEDLIKANAKMLVKAETVERDRFQKLLDAVQAEFRNDKDELWELKQAVALIRMEIRYRAGERAAKIVVEQPAPIQPEPSPPELAGIGGGGGSGSGYGHGRGTLFGHGRYPGVVPDGPDEADDLSGHHMGDEESAPPPPTKSVKRRPRRPSRSEIAKVAKQADEVISSMADEDSIESSPLHKLSF